MCIYDTGVDEIDELDVIDDVDKIRLTHEFDDTSLTIEKEPILYMVYMLKQTKQRPYNPSR